MGSANNPTNTTNCQHHVGPSPPGEIKGPGPLPALCDITLEGRWVLCRRLAAVDGWAPHLAPGGVDGAESQPFLYVTCCCRKAFCPSSFCSRGPSAGDSRLLLEIYLVIYLSVGVSGAGFFSSNSGIMREKESASHSWPCCSLVLRFLAGRSLLSTFQSLLMFVLQIKVQAFSFT